MGKEEKKELQDRGFVILEKAHLIIIIIITVIGFVVSGLVQKELLAQTVYDHETRIKVLEDESKIKHDLLLELKYNLKAFMEESGVKYQEIVKQRP